MVRLKEDEELPMADAEPLTADEVQPTMALIPLRPDAEVALRRHPATDARRHQLQAVVVGETPSSAKHSRQRNSNEAEAK